MVSRRTFLSATAAGAAAGLVPTATAVAGARRAFDTDPAAAALRRLIGSRADQVDLRALARTGQDRYRVSGDAGRVVVAGTSPAVLLAGFGRYLGHVARAGVWWAGEQLDLPARLPVPARPIERSANVAHRFALNDTNDGYTGPYWDFARWQREIDILALHGINEVLVYLGADSVYRDTFRGFGYSDEELRAWIPAPAHQPWWLLQNMSGFDSPVSDALLDTRADLAARVIDHLRSLGMTPVLPGYYGTVPPSFVDRNPGARVVPQGNWGGFARPDWLDPRNGYFPRVAEAFYTHQRDRYGDSTMYKMDLLHEGGNPGDVPVGEASAAVEKALRTAHPDAIWAILGWQNNPRPQTLAAVDRSRMLILDGLSDRYADLDREKDWSGTPYAFGSIFNFGGHTTIGANSSVWTEKYPRWRDKPNSALSGIAIMPEAADNNPAAFDLFTDLAWSDGRVATKTWFADYATRRYGGTDPHAAAAWDVLRTTAYAMPDDGWSEAQDSLFSARPGLDVTSACAYSPRSMRYDAPAFDAALTELLAVSGRLRRGDAYRYDLVDVARQALANRSRVLVPQIKAAYQARDIIRFEELTGVFLDWIALLDRLVGSRPEFLLGTRLAQARARGGDQAESDRLEFDQRSLITVWGTRAASEQGLHDYANREWSGLIRGLYAVRWRTFFDSLHTALRSGRPPAPIDWFAMENGFARRHDHCPTDPSGDPYALATQVHRTLATDTHQLVGTASAAPGVLRPGDPTTLTAALTNTNGFSTARSVSASPAVPDGLTVTPLTPTTLSSLDSGKTMTTRWRLDVPVDFHAGHLVTALRVETTFRTGPRHGRTVATARVLSGGPVAAPYRTANFNSATFAQSGDELGIAGGGADMWGGTNQFGTIYLPSGLTDGGTATVTVTGQDPTGPWARAGIVVRNQLATNGTAGYLDLAVTPANGCALSADTNGDGRLDTVRTAGPSTTPVTLRLTRSGTTFTAVYRTDSTQWTTVGTVTVPGAAAHQDVGVFTCAANGGSGATGLATFHAFTIGH